MLRCCPRADVGTGAGIAGAESSTKQTDPVTDALALPPATESVEGNDAKRLKTDS